MVDDECKVGGRSFKTRGPEAAKLRDPSNRHKCHCGWLLTSWLQAVEVDVKLWGTCCGGRHWTGNVGVTVMLLDESRTSDDDDGGVR